MGVSEEDIAAAQKAAPAPEPFGIWEENWHTWLVFMSLGDRWTYAGGPNGLERTGGPAHTDIESSLRLLELPRRERRQAFEDLKQMIWAVLELDREQ